jgi:hypothetical protein
MAGISRWTIVRLVRFGPGVRHTACRAATSSTCPGCRTRWSPAWKPVPVDWGRGRRCIWPAPSAFPSPRYSRSPDGTGGVARESAASVGPSPAPASSSWATCPRCSPRARYFHRSTGKGHACLSRLRQLARAISPGRGRATAGASRRPEDALMLDPIPGAIPLELRVQPCVVLPPRQATWMSC